MLDDKASSTLGSPRFGKSPALVGQGEVQAARQGELDPDDLPSANRPDSDTLPQDVVSPIQSGMEEVCHVLNSLGVNPHLIRVAAFPPEGMTILLLKLSSMAPVHFSTFGTTTKPRVLSALFTIWKAIQAS
jgi:hypothetical protein